MIFYNITMLMLTLNLSMSMHVIDDGLLRIDYRHEYHGNYGGMFTPVYNKRGIISIWTPNKDEIIPILIHELKHLNCWRLEGNSGYIQNIQHKGCFNKPIVYSQIINNQIGYYYDSEDIGIIPDPNTNRK